MATNNYSLATFSSSSIETFGSLINTAFGETNSNMSKIDTALYDNYKQGIHTSISTAYGSNTYTCPLPDLSDKIFISFVPSEDNIGAVSLTDVSITKSLKKFNSSGILETLSGGELKAGHIHLMYYSLADDSFVLYDLSTSKIIDTTITEGGTNPVSGGTLFTALNAKVNSSQVLTDVPANAVFTDTVYVHPTTSGNKHIPSGGSIGQFLKYSSDGTVVWSVDNNTVYTHPTTSGNKHIPSGGADGQVLKYDSDGVVKWDTDNDTTYQIFSTTESGLVPSPTTSNTTQYLRANGTWGTPPNTVYTHPTTSGNVHIPTGGSTGQFLKWLSDGTAQWSADNNTIYVHPTTAGNKHIPTGGSLGQFLKYSSSGTAVWAADNDTTYDVASTSANGLMSSTDKTKLDGIAQADWDATVGGAVILNKPTIPTAYVHPTTSGNKHIPTGGATGQFLKYSSSGTAVWANDNDTIYTHPTNHSADIIEDGVINKVYTATEKGKLGGMNLTPTILTLGNFRIKHNTTNDTLDFEYII